jgi:GTPase SAR1 family protein
VSIELWDTAGQEKYAAISSIYYKGAQFVVLVYDLNEPVDSTELLGQSVQKLAKKHPKLRKSRRHSALRRVN